MKTTTGRATIGRQLRLLSRVAVLAVLAFGLAFTAGIPPAAAKGPKPQLQSVRLEGTELFFTFTLPTNDDLGGVWLTVRERDNPDRIILDGQDMQDLYPVPPANRAINRQRGGMPPGVPVCVTLESYDYVELFDFESGRSGPSNTICAEPAKSGLPDVEIDVRGKQDREVVSTGQREQANQFGYGSPVYIKNVGTGDATNIVVDIATAGVTTLSPDQNVPTPNWTGAGFNCAPTPPSGGDVTGNWHCTGGTLKPGEEKMFIVMVKFSRPGFGHTHGSVSAPGETKTDNNTSTLNQQVS